MKPIKRGYKLWCLADNHGYIYQYGVYTGKNDAVATTVKQYSLGGQVVPDLTQHLGGKKL